MRRFQAAIENLGVPVLPLDGPLQNAMFRVGAEDGHPNVAANGVIAWELFRFLRHNGLIPARHLRPPPRHP